MTFDEWWESLTEFEQASRHYYDLLVGWEGAQALGIKTHDGQKILVQHILDTDSGLSENSRKILEELIK